jgi:inhibitor of KinA sporulation pathway (predicted exonuclease)
MPTIKNRDIKYFTILDLEGTFEISELSSVIVDENCNIIDKIQIFCKNYYVEDDVFKKYINEKYGKFGLEQKFFNECVPLWDAFSIYENWIHKSIKNNNFIFLTCGNWDLGKQIPLQCINLGIDKPSYFSRYVNIKDIFQRLNNIESKGMDFMLKHYNIELDGNHHCALDDCLNLVKLVKHMNNIINENNFDINQYYRVRVKK